MLGWGGGDVNVPCTCTHVGCYAKCWVGVGGMQRTAAKSLLERKWSTKCGAILMISCPIHNESKATRLINDQIWEYLYSWQWRQNAGKDLWTNMHEVFAEWKQKTPLIRYSNSSAPLTRTPPCLWFCMWHLETLKSRGRKRSAFSKPFTRTTGRIQMNLLCSNISRSSWSLGINWTVWMVLGHELCWSPQWKDSRLRCVQTISKHLKIYILWFKGIPNRSSAHRIICHIHTFAIY